MSGRIARSKSLTHTQANAVRKYLDDAKKLPEHGEEWLRIEIGLSKGALNAFSRAGIIKPQDRDEENPSRRYWMTADGIGEWVDFHYRKQDHTPCENATGFHTIEPGVYTCTDPDCDCRMDRETVKEVFA